MEGGVCAAWYLLSLSGLWEDRAIVISQTTYGLFFFSLLIILISDNFVTCKEIERVSYCS